MRFVNAEKTGSYTGNGAPAPRQNFLSLQSRGLVCSFWLAVGIIFTLAALFSHDSGCQALAAQYVPVQRQAPTATGRPFPKLPPKRQTDSAPPVSRQVKSPSFTSQGEAPPAELPEAVPASSTGIQLFGTVEFRRPLETLPGWLDVIRRNQQEPVFIPDKKFIAGTTWAKLKEKAENLDTMGKLRLINEFWNRQPYREDIQNWQKEDYWAIPAQFIRKSGDCEDYAIAKYFTLKELGIDPASMRIVVLRDTIRNLAHAVLAVYVNGNAYILDNVSNIILPHSRIRNYRPQFSVNEFGRWTHIKGKSAR